MNDIIKEFAQASTAAEENPGLLIKYRHSPDYAKYEKLCVERMNKVMESEQQLLAMPESDENPKELNRYIRASKDQGCEECWYSSSSATWSDHPECSKKMEEFFVARQLLINYGVKL